MNELTVEKLRESVELVLNNPSYKEVFEFEGIIPNIGWI